MSVRQLLLVSTCVLAGACASSSGRTASSPCTLSSADSIYLASGPVYRDCAVEQRASVIDRSFRPNFRPDEHPPGGEACYSAAIQFVVDETGMPERETARVLHANNPTFADAALETVKHWRYKPAYLHDAPVRQIVEEKVEMTVAVVVVPAGETPRPPARMPRC